MNGITIILIIFYFRFLGNMRALIVIAFLLGAKTVVGQTSTYYSMRNYKAIDGLPQSKVNIMLEDKNGYLWVGTQGGGLARFDGREFKVYTTLDGLLNNFIIYLKLDDRQNLWIIHPRGITKFDGIRFKKIQPKGYPFRAQRIRRAFEFKDTLFFTTAPGNLGKIYDDSVYYWSKPLKEGVLVSYTHVTPERDIVICLSDSSLFIRSDEGDYFMSHKGRFDRLYNIFNYKNKVWLTTDKGHFTINFARRDFEPATFPITNHFVYHDTLNDVFWTRSGTDLLKVMLKGDSIVTETVLKDQEVSQVLVDSEGNTWIATQGSGLYKYFIQDFNRCTSERLRAITAILTDSRGANWVGSKARGLWKIKKGKVSSYISKEASRNEILCIAESPDTTIWVGTGYGLGHYDECTDTFRWYNRDDGLSNTTITSLQFDEKGGVWIGTHSGGVNYFDGNSFTAYTTKQGLNTNAVITLYYSKRYKKLLVGNEFGISTIDRGKIGKLDVPGIENTAVTSIQPYCDSLLLIGTGGAGLAILHPEKRSAKVITTHHGLVSDFIYFAAVDDRRYIWVGSEKGITRIKLNNAFEIVQNLHYDYDNGLEGVETNLNAFYLSPERKYFGLIDGLYEFNELKRNTQRSFDLHLTNVEILYGQYSLRNYSDSLIGFFKIPYKPSLPADKNHVTFHFNRVDKRYPKSVRFKYFLENFDNTWSQPSSNNQVTYSNLPPGEYVFKVMATDNQGSWSSESVVYPFSVKAPFYHTTSFYATLFVLCAGLITLALYLRVKQRVKQVVVLERIRAKEQENLRKEIARDFHDEMGNQLTRIINYVSLLKLNGNGGGNSDDLYAKVEDSAKYLYTGTRDFIWSIDPGNDELSKLFIHIRDFGEKLFEEKNISFRAFNEVWDKHKLPYGFSREANLIFKEVMTNAFKYSGAKNVSLYLLRRDDTFELSFEDDGVGFYSGEIVKSNGLKNIRERADRINATLRIQSEKYKGTKVVLSFKLNKTSKYGFAL